MSKQNEMGQFAQVPTWVLAYLAEKFPHPASYGRALRTYSLIASVARHGRVERPTRLAAHGRRGGVSAQSVKRGAKGLEDVGLLSRIHQRTGNLRTASKYVLATTVEEVGRLEQCACRECAAKRLRERSGESFSVGSATARSETVRSASARSESDLGGSDVVLVHTVSQSEAPVDETTAAKQQEQTLTPHSMNAASPEATAPHAPDSDGDTTANSRETPNPPDSAPPPLPPDPRFEKMVAEIASRGGRLGLERGARKQIRAAYEAHPAGLRWVMNQAMSDADDQSSYIGLVLAKLKNNDHLATLRYSHEGILCGGMELHLCRDCEATGFLPDGQICGSCRCGHIELDGYGCTTWEEVEEKFGVRVMVESAPRPDNFMRQHLAAQEAKAAAEGKVNNNVR